MKRNANISDKKRSLIKKLKKDEKHETRAEEKKESPAIQKLEKKYKIEKHGSKRRK